MSQFCPQRNLLDQPCTRPAGHAGRCQAAGLDDVPFRIMPDGHIDNCSLAWGHPEADCQLCAGKPEWAPDGYCPDRLRLAVPASITPGHERRVIHDMKLVSIGAHADGSFSVAGSVDPADVEMVASNVTELPRPPSRPWMQTDAFGPILTLGTAELRAALAEGQPDLEIRTTIGALRTLLRSLD